MECVNIQGYNLGQKLLRILHFLCVTKCQSCRFGCAEAPLLTLGWSMLFSWGQKWSSRTSTLFFIFFGGGGEGEYLKLPMLSRALSWYVLDMEIFVQNCSCLIPYFYMLLTKVNIEKNLYLFQIPNDCFLFLQRTRLYHQGLRFVQLLWIKTLWRKLRLKMRRFLQYKWVYFHLLVTFGL